MQKEPKFLTIAQAAQFLGVSPDTLRRWEERGIVTPHRTKGGSRRYTLLDLKIAKLNKRKVRFFQLPTLLTKNYINSKQDLRIALLTSVLWIFGLLTYHFLSPILFKPTNLQQAAISDQIKDQTHLKIASETTGNEINTIKNLALPDSGPATSGLTPKSVTQGTDLLIRRSGDLPTIQYTNALNKYYSLQPLPKK